MATFKICIFKHQKRQDDKYPVSIRVCWKRQYGYIKTEFYVSEKQITKRTFTIKDTYIINELNRRIVIFEELKSKKLGFKIDLYSAKELAEYFTKETSPDSSSKINFIEFARLHIQRIKDQGRISTASTLDRVTNALIDFCNGRDKVYINEITSKFLQQFESFLRSDRTLVRHTKQGRTITVKNKGLSDVSVFDYMTDVRTLFNAAIEEYNDEDKDEVRIMHYPFRKYKLKRRPETAKRNLSVDQIKSIIYSSDSDLKPERAVFARDVFVLSFLLVGMNTIDLYNATSLVFEQQSNHHVGNNEMVRIEYNRQKTKSRRQDRAFISIKVEPEAIPLLQKYRDPDGKRVFDFYKRYACASNFRNNVNKKLKIVANVCNIDVRLTTYYARHSWATIARNKCGISKDDIDLALNHVDSGMKMADVYIEKDWKLIDIANRSVINMVFNAK